MKNKRGAEVIHIYTPRLEMKVINIFFLVVFLFTQTSMFIPPRDIPVSTLLSYIPFLLFDAFLIWYVFKLCTQIRLLIYEDGIVVQHGSVYHFSPWENMSHFGRQGDGRNSRYGIFLLEKVKPESGSFLERFCWGGSSNFLELDQEFFDLPKRWLGLFRASVIDLDRLYDSTFGQEIYPFAPQLFETEKVKINSRKCFR
jgi:hypothetical protein